jgi:thiol-disulfide isomerase/thioredoxin
MKISIYAGAPIQRVLEGYGDNRSGRLNTVAERYAYVVERDCPALTEAQWCAVCDALNGYWIDGGDSGAGVRLAWAEIEDADRLDGLGEKWGVDAHALAVQLRDSTAGQQVAVAEIVQRFWRHADLPAREALAKAGARYAVG